MDKSKTRGGQAPFPETPVLASISGVVWKAVEEFYDRLINRSSVALRALGYAAGLQAVSRDETDWDEALVRECVPEGPLRDGILKYMAETNGLNERQSAAFWEAEALRSWYVNQQAAKVDAQRAAGAGEAEQ